MAGKPVRTTLPAANDNTAAPKPADRRKASPTSVSATPKSTRKQPLNAAKPVVATRKTTHRPDPANEAPTPRVVRKTQPVGEQQKADKPEKPKKIKLVRDSFTMPETEYALIAALKKRCLEAGVSAKKSEILRAAVAGLAKLSDKSVVSAIRRLDVIKTGRPAKGSK